MQIKKTAFFSIFASILLITSAFYSASSYGAMQGSEPETPEKLIVVIIPSYNNLERYQRNIDSVLCQKYRNYRVVYVDDCSNDGMSEEVPAYIKKHDREKRWVYVRNAENQGAMYNLYHAIHACPDEAVVVMLDGDDFFKHENALSRINQEYADESIWVTYGQFELWPEDRIGHCKPYSKDVIKENEIYLSVNIDNPASLKVQLNNEAYIHHSDEKEHYTRIKI